MIPDKTEILKDSCDFFQLEVLIDNNASCLTSILNEVIENLYC